MHAYQGYRTSIMYQYLVPKFKNTGHTVIPSYLVNVPGTTVREKGTVFAVRVHYTLHTTRITSTVQHAILQYCSTAVRAPPTISYIPPVTGTPSTEYYSTQLALRYGNTGYSSTP